METAKSNCRECARQTNHQVLYEVATEGDYSFYAEKYLWQTLKCKGCDTIGFRMVYIDFEDLDEDENGRAVPSKTYSRFPAAIARHKALEDLWAVPALIKKVYMETISAYAVGSKVIAGMGLRATIEAVCSHLKVSGRTLDKRIDALHRNGNISSADKKRLHAIRFLGNDAAHEIRVPGDGDLRVALEIVEHLIKSVFILEKRARGLDTSIETMDELMPVLKKCLGKLEVDSINSLAFILGAHARRLGDAFPVLEAELIKQIEEGTVPFLALDAVQEGDKKAVQTYKLTQKTADMDDIPF